MVKPNDFRFLRTALFFSLLINLAGAVFLGYHYWTKAHLKLYVPPPKLPYYMSRDKLFETLPPDSNAVVFLGASLTQYYELAEFFPNVRVKNRGIHGDEIEKALKRLSPIIASKPKKIFIEMGSNDVDLHVPTEKIIAAYARLLDTLKTACPTTRLYVQSLLPAADSSRYLDSYCSPQTNKTIVQVNAALRRLAAQKNVTFINLHERFLQNGQLAPQYTVDGAHLSGEGYRLWTEILKPYVEE